MSEGTKCLSTEGFLLFAIDPGEKTGVAIWDDEAKTLVTHEVVTIDDEGIDELVKLIDTWGPKLLIVEDFVLRPSGIQSTARSGLSPVRITSLLMGFLRGRALNNEDAYCPAIELQMPAQAKGFATNERLKRWGWWVKGSAHKRDAVRHLLLYASKHDWFKSC